MNIDYPRTLYLLFILLPVTVLIIQAWRRSSSALVRFIGELPAGYQRSWPGHLVLVLLIVLGSIGALSGPRWGRGEIYRTYRGIEIIFCIDISNSMLAEDLGTARLVAVRDFVYRTLAEQPEALAGVVLFKGEGILTIPLTMDHHVIRDFTDAVSPALQTVPGTNIEKGLIASLKGFPPGSARRRMVFLLTDGETTGGDPRRVVPLLRETEASVWSFITGTAEGGEITLDSGETRVSRADTSALVEITEQPECELFRLDDPRWMDLYLEKLSSLTEGSNRVTARQVTKERYYLLLLAVIAAFIGCSFIRIKK